MRHRSLLVVSMVLSIGFVSLAGVAVAGEEEDLAAINKVRDQEVATLNEASPGSVAMVYCKEVEFIPPSEPALKGIEAVEQWMTAMTDQFEGHLEYTASDVTLLGDWAVEQYAGNVTLTPKAGGDPMVEQVRGIHVYHRDKDGHWKITHDIWNYAAPAEASE